MRRSRGMIRDRSVLSRLSNLSEADIPDPNLRAAIKTNLGKASDEPITNFEMAFLSGLEAPSSNISDLTGLELATNLTFLHLGYMVGFPRNSNNIYEQRGKPVFLNFWGTWCGPCVAEMPDIQKLQNTMGDSIQIVGIGVRDTRNQEIRFITRYGCTWTFVLDSIGEVNNTYEVSGIPRSFFIDAKGVIVRVLRGGPQPYETFLEATRQAINN